MGVSDDMFLLSLVQTLTFFKSACLDLCDDCRLTTGSHVVAWTFVPLALCEPKIKPDLAIGTNKIYVSSPGIVRSFCDTCGATVFFTCDERRPNDDQIVVDLSVGLLRAPEGVAAENWLTWRAGRLAWHDSGLRFDEEFTKSLAENIAKWSTDKYGDAPTFTIG